MGGVTDPIPSATAATAWGAPLVALLLLLPAPVVRRDRRLDFAVHGRKPPPGPAHHAAQPE